MQLTHWGSICVVQHSEHEEGRGVCVCVCVCWVLSVRAALRSLAGEPPPRLIKGKATRFQRLQRRFGNVENSAIIPGPGEKKTVLDKNAPDQGTPEKERERECEREIHLPFTNLALHQCPQKTHYQFLFL